MKHHFTFILIFTFLPFLCVAKERVAILNLKNEASLKSVEVVFLSDVVREVFSKTKQHNELQIMTKENINALLEKPLEECTSEVECEITLGRNLQAQILVTGEILKIEKQYRFFIRAYHVADANLVASESGKGDLINDLEVSLRKASENLLIALGYEPIGLIKKVADEAKDKINEKPNSQSLATQDIQEQTKEKNKSIVSSNLELVGRNIGITQVQLLSSDIMQEYGITSKYALMILAIEEGSEAALAGLKVEDILLLNQVSSIEALNENLQKLNFYEPARIKYLRSVNGTYTTLHVDFWKRPYLMGVIDNYSIIYSKNLIERLPLHDFIIQHHEKKYIDRIEIKSINQEALDNYSYDSICLRPPFINAHKKQKWLIRLITHVHQNPMIQNEGTNKTFSYFINLKPNQYFVWDRVACANQLY